MNYLKIDFRVASLNTTINGLSESIDVLHKQISEIEYYDGDWFLEESEPIYGLAFIAFQNYINGSIKDFANSLNEKELFYKLEQNIHGAKRSNIELIIALANYTKHKDEGALHKGTKSILDNFGLTYENVIYLDKSPIFEGLTLLNTKWDLFQIKNIVTDWRELLWSKVD